MRLPSAPFKAAASASASICPRATRPVLRWSSHDAGRSAGRFYFPSGHFSVPLAVKVRSTCASSALPICLPCQSGSTKQMVKGNYRRSIRRQSPPAGRRIPRPHSCSSAVAAIEILQPATPRREARSTINCAPAGRSGAAPESPLARRGGRGDCAGSAMIEDLAIVHF
ncbi:Uncharacterised protein [Klebsiella pneumoniae]|uniref:Uncharacterized protein n=1 Tax=Klebsiella pneumoniae TaxID=573 RepID=A0A2X3GZ36_KLEPN|nr:Uncharacterised protein [Klebsiella pneumoniae]